MTTEWLDLQKNAVVPALKKAGVKTRTVYASGVFGEAFTYMLVVPMNEFAEFDTAENQAQALGLVADAKIAERLRIVSSARPVFSAARCRTSAIRATPRSQPSSVFLRLRIVPGKMEAYVNLYKREVLPRLKKADSKVSVASRPLGRDGYDLTFEARMTKFSDLDAPPALVRAFGPETIAKALAKLNPLATLMENTILVRQSDLSFWRPDGRPRELSCFRFHIGHQDP
jgi:hypothetical protein